MALEAALTDCRVEIHVTLTLPLTMPNYLALNPGRCNWAGARENIHSHPALVGWVPGKASGLYKTERWDAGVAICLKWGADLHMTQLMPLPLTVACFSKSQIGFTFPVPAHQEKGPLNGCVCVCILGQVMWICSTLKATHVGNVRHLQSPC